MIVTPFTELSNSIAVDVPSFPLRCCIRLGGAMGCESCIKFRTDKRTIVVLSLSGSDGTSAVCLPVHESLVAFGMEILTDRRFAPSLRWISRIIDRRSCNLWVGPRSRWILVSLINACWHSSRRCLPMPASPPFFDDFPGAERPGVAGLEGCGEDARLKLRLKNSLTPSFSL